MGLFLRLLLSIHSSIMKLFTQFYIQITIITANAAFFHSTSSLIINNNNQISHGWLSIHTENKLLATDRLSGFGGFGHTRKIIGEKQGMTLLAKKKKSRKSNGGEGDCINALKKEEHEKLHDDEEVKEVIENIINQEDLISDKTINEKIPSKSQNEKKKQNIEVIEKIEDKTTNERGENKRKEVTIELAKSNINEIDKKEMKSISPRYVYDNGLFITTDEEGRITARPPLSQDLNTINQSNKHDEALNQVGREKDSPKIIMANSKNKESEVSANKVKESSDAQPGRIIIPGINLPTISKTKPIVEDVPKPIISGGFNVVLTHCTADFDTLASAVGLAKLWSTSSTEKSSESSAFESSSGLPTFVVLPRGAHPSVQRFLSLHKHLFPIRSLKSLPNDLSKLHRLGLVDAQTRDRVGPAEILIGHADRVTIVDHHIDGTSDIPEATDYIIDHVGAVSTMVAERLREFGAELTEAEATLLALGIHGDTGSLCFDSATARDAEALAWVMKQGASQAAIAENVHSQLSREQQGVLTNALINTNSTVVHGVTVSTVLLR